MPAGLIVLVAEAGGPAEKAGVLVGDVLLSVEGQAIEDLQDLQAVLGSDSVGKSVKAVLVRGGEIVALAIVVGERSK